MLLFSVMLFGGARIAAGLDKPHILFLLIDDFGWADAGWHRPANYSEVKTPHMDELVRNGIELERNMAFKFSSPTRCAIQSGRNPIHVNAQNVGMDRHDPKNPFVGVSGIPVNMTGFAQRLAEAGYKHRTFAGKADFGMAYRKQTPMGRGYTDTLYYHQHMNDWWSLNVGRCGPPSAKKWTRDLYGTTANGKEGPRYDLLNPPSCWVQNMSGAEDPVRPFPANMTGCVYEEDFFTNFTLSHILSHDPAKDGPMLAFHATHSIHTPLEVVPDAFEEFSFISDSHDRRTYAAMVYNVDRAIGRLVGALRSKGMYDDTLIILSSDNGGPIYMQGRGAGNNYPLKGGKAGNWEGGIRVNGFVSGGAVPAHMRGTKLDGLLAVWDWYATLVQGVAGLDPTDTEAAAAGLPPLDSVNQWEYLMGRTTLPPRQSLPIGTTRDPTDTWAIKNDIVVHGLIQAQGADKLWKLLLGRAPQSIWTGPQFPNHTTTTLPPAEHVYGDCGFDPGCLFELKSDPTEHRNVAKDNPAVVRRLRDAIAKINATVFAPKRPFSAQACEVSLRKYHDPRYDFGWWGPFVEG